MAGSELDRLAGAGLTPAQMADAKDQAKDRERLDAINRAGAEAALAELRRMAWARFRTAVAADPELRALWERAEGAGWLEAPAEVFHDARWREWWAFAAGLLIGGLVVWWRCRG